MDAPYLQKPVPGPGAYNPKDNSSAVSSLMMGRVRDNSLDEKIKVPGPGRYELPALTGLERIIESKKMNSRLPVISK